MVHSHPAIRPKTVKNSCHTRVLVCPDSFKGTLTAGEAAEAMRCGVKDAIPGAETVLLPVGDGGEGTVEALAATLARNHRVEWAECAAVDPLRRPIKCRYAVVDGHVALIESASASGLTLLVPAERDILNADTYGTGMMIAHAHSLGIREFIIGMGGTATCDGGRGVLQALADTPLDGNEKFTLLCDVDNPLLGSRGAATVFAPQKGASPDEIPVLEARLAMLAKQYKKYHGVDVSSMRCAGAAGGLAGMLMACFGTRAVDGIGFLLDAADFDTLLAEADVVVTGEGRLDRTTLSGKAPKGILDRAMRADVPVIAIGGSVDGAGDLLRAGFAAVYAATPEGVAPGERAAEYLRMATAEAMRRWKNRLE